MIISTRACYAVYVNTMCEIRQKTTKKTERRLAFFRKCDRSEKGTSFTGSESWYSICSLVFSTNINVLWLHYIMSSSPLLLFIPCIFRLAPVLTTRHQLVTIEKPWHQFQSLSILRVRFPFTCNSTILQIQCWVSVNDNFSYLNK